MKGYWIILSTDVADIQTQQEYGQLWKPIAEKYKAVIRVLDAAALLESQGTSRVLVVVEFPSYAEAKACYEDPAYKHAKHLALRAANRQLLIIEGDLSISAP